MQVLPSQFHAAVQHAEVVDTEAFVELRPDLDPASLRIACLLVYSGLLLGLGGLL